MTNKHLKKFIILSFVVSMFVFCATPKVFASNADTYNTDLIIHIDNDAYIANQIVQPRHISDNSRGRTGEQDFTTWAGVILLSVIILIALKTLPLEKRL